jgi:hypothetical protein
MNFAIWIGLLIDAALLVWFVISVREIKGYLRRIALSLPVSPEQMKLINGTISTEELMSLFEKSGGTISAEVKAFEGLPTSEFMALSNTNHVDREVVKILQGRESDVLLILKSRRTSNP